MKRRVFTVDATRIAQESIGLRKPNTPMLGAIAKLTGVVLPDALWQAIEARVPRKWLKQNRRAFEKGMELVGESVQAAAGSARMEAFTSCDST